MLDSHVSHATISRNIHIIRPRQIKCLGRIIRLEQIKRLRRVICLRRVKR